MNAFKFGQQLASFVLVVLLGGPKAFAAANIKEISQVKEEISQFKRLGPGRVSLNIITQEKDSIQAAQYLNGKEIDQYIQFEIADLQSDLAKLKNEIQAKACPEKNDQFDCGDVVWTKPAQTAFERGGWTDGMAELTVFMGYRYHTSGFNFRAHFAIRIIETVEAKVNQAGEYAGEIEKIYTIHKIHPFWVP